MIDRDRVNPWAWKDGVAYERNPDGTHIWRWATVAGARTIEHPLGEAWALGAAIINLRENMQILSEDVGFSDTGAHDEEAGMATKAIAHLLGRMEP